MAPLCTTYLFNILLSTTIISTDSDHQFSIMKPAKRILKKNHPQTRGNTRPKRPPRCRGNQIAVRPSVPRRSLESTRATRRSESTGRLVAALSISLIDKGPRPLWWSGTQDASLDFVVVLRCPINASRRRDLRERRTL